jgi:DNA-binding MarR family transcriptional regulator
MDKIRKDEYETLAAFRYMLRQFLRFSEEAAKEANLTPQQHQALLAVMGYPNKEGITIGELAERLQVRHHSAVGLVDRLEAQGLVSRQQDELDRRQVLVQLTPGGVAALEQLSAAHREELRRIGPQLQKILEALDVKGGGEAGTGSP